MQEQPPIQCPLIDLPSRQVTQLSTANSSVSRPPDLPSNLPEQGASPPKDMATTPTKVEVASSPPLQYYQ